MLGAILLKKVQKKHKFLGRDLKKIFLPNKKPYSVVSGAYSNFLRGG